MNTDSPEVIKKVREISEELGLELSKETLEALIDIVGIGIHPESIVSLIFELQRQEKANRENLVQ